MHFFSISLFNCFLLTHIISTVAVESSRPMCVTQGKGKHNNIKTKNVDHSRISFTDDIALLLCTHFLHFFCAGFPVHSSKIVLLFGFGVLKNPLFQFCTEDEVVVVGICNKSGKKR